MLSSRQRRRLGQSVRRVVACLLVAAIALVASKDSFSDSLLPASLHRAESVLWVIAHRELLGPRLVMGVSDYETALWLGSSR